MKPLDMSIWMKDISMSVSHLFPFSSSFPLWSRLTLITLREKPLSTLEKQIIALRLSLLWSLSTASSISQPDASHQHFHVSPRNNETQSGASPEMSVCEDVTFQLWVRDRHFYFSGAWLAIDLLVQLQKIDLEDELIHKEIHGHSYPLTQLPLAAWISSITLRALGGEAHIKDDI